MKIKDLDRNEVYSLEEIKKDSAKFDLLKEWLKENDNRWDEFLLSVIKDYKTLKYINEFNGWYLFDLESPTKCALTLFDLDITDYQVDCIDLSKEQIEEMAEVVKSRGYKLWDYVDSLGVYGVNKFFQYFNKTYMVASYTEDKTTITYDKFMELFGKKPIEQAVEELAEAFEENTSDFKQITDSISSLLEYKNKKYGNSALEPLNIFTNKCKVGQRLDDKLARVKNSTELKKNDVADLIGYLILTCKENGWNNFDEFKD